MHEISQRSACEAVGKRDCFGSAEGDACEKLKGPALFPRRRDVFEEASPSLTRGFPGRARDFLLDQCAAVPVPVLRELCNENGDRRAPVPHGYQGGAGFAYGPTIPVCPHARNNDAPLGIAWTEKWPPERIT